MSGASRISQREGNVIQKEVTLALVCLSEARFFVSPCRAWSPGPLALNAFVLKPPTAHPWGNTYRGASLNELPARACLWVSIPVELLRAARVLSIRQA